MRSTRSIVVRPDTFNLWQSVGCMQGHHSECEWAPLAYFPSGGCDCICHSNESIPYKVTSRVAL
jgi:hypothetical protein